MTIIPRSVGSVGEDWFDEESEGDDAGHVPVIVSSRVVTLDGIGYRADTTARGAFGVI